MRIGLLGDTHGNVGWTGYALNKFHREGVKTILQLGDFGIWPGHGGTRFLDRVNDTMRLYEQTMIVVPGNHEDYDQIDELPVSGDGFQHLREFIRLAPRGHRWVWQGVSFVALGGAPSVDRTYRCDKDLGWWPGEAITEADVQRVIDGGRAEVMVAHDAPFVPSIERRIAGNPGGYVRRDLDYADEGRELMDRAFRAVSPALFLHGHYHFPVDEIVGDSRVLGLSSDNRNFSLGLLDTDDMKAEAWDIRQDCNEYMRGLR